LALRPDTVPSLSELVAITEEGDSHHIDVRDQDATLRVVRDAEPEIVFHLAAQPLVRPSYERPVDTFATNVLGTIHVLNALRSTTTIRAIVVVTSDKVYRNDGLFRGYRETDVLGGHDPYSSSKACTELAVESWRLSFFNRMEDPVGVATARAGNVIGGGDWAADRLIPDLIRAFAHGKPAQIRRPEAVRSWIHVLDPLVGYLLLAERLTAAPADFSKAWNFGPSESGIRTVESVACRSAILWGGQAKWEASSDVLLHEAPELRLDATKATEWLRWRPRLEFDHALEWTIDWYRRWHSGEKPAMLCAEQIGRYLPANKS
jgi:CDP-glucose 4,6-dehydratase